MSIHENLWRQSHRHGEAICGLKRCQEQPDPKVDILFLAYLNSWRFGWQALAGKLDPTVFLYLRTIPIMN
jgi:hypothetical protein